MVFVFPLFVSAGTARPGCFTHRITRQLLASLQPPHRSAPAAHGEADRRTDRRTGAIADFSPGAGRSRAPPPPHPRPGPPRHVTRGDAAVPRSRHSPGPRRERSGSRRSRRGPGRQVGGCAAPLGPPGREGGDRDGDERGAAAAGTAGQGWVAPRGSVRARAGTGAAAPRGRPAAPGAPRGALLAPAGAPGGAAPRCPRRRRRLRSAGGAGSAESAAPGGSSAPGRRRGPRCRAAGPGRPRCRVRAAPAHLRETKGGSGGPAALPGRPRRAGGICRPCVNLSAVTWGGWAGLVGAAEPRYL